MVYINENSGTVTIPRHTQYTYGGYTLSISSNVSDTIDLVTDGNNISTNPLYYRFVLGSLDNISVGDYHYKLYDAENNLIESGLLSFGSYNREVTVNNTFNNQKIQYNG